MSEGQEDGRRYRNYEVIEKGKIRNGRINSCTFKKQRDGDVFFPEFNVNDFDMTIGETSGDDIKYTRTIYTRKK